MIMFYNKNLEQTKKLNANVKFLYHVFQVPT